MMGFWGPLNGGGGSWGRWVDFSIGDTEYMSGTWVEYSAVPESSISTVGIIFLLTALSEMRRRRISS